MEIQIRFVVVAMAVAMSGFALADAAFRPGNAGFGAPLAARAPPQECWVEHVQVQPARASDRGARGKPAGFGTTSWASGEHLGSEHWNADAQRACRLQWLTDIAARPYGSGRYALDN